MKLYTWTKKRSLPRLALKGLPAGADLDHESRAEMWLDSMYGDDEPGDRNVLLAVDVDGLEEILEVDGDWAYYLLESGDVKREDFEGWTDLEKTSGLFGYMVTNGTVPPERITVLGLMAPGFGEATDIPWDGSMDEILKKALVFDPKPLKAFKQPLVTRLLRSIFLPKHKLYGAGKKVTMGIRLARVDA